MNKDNIGLVILIGSIVLGFLSVELMPYHENIVILYISVLLMFFLGSVGMFLHFRMLFRKSKSR